MRIALHQQVIFERARLALVGVADDVARFDLLIDELPLHAGRKPGAAAAAQTRRFDELDDLVGLLAERCLQRVVAAVLQIEVERERVRLAHVFGEDRVHDVSMISSQSRGDTRITPLRRGHADRRRASPRPQDEGTRATRC